jgi:predicted ATPase/class 3 adenylate cyclase
LRSSPRRSGLEAAHAGGHSSAIRSELPLGTVTFLFTDVEGSTRLLNKLGTERYAEELARHRQVIREACAQQCGAEVDTQGDAFFFAFESAASALVAAETLTEALSATPIRVRVGVHTGTPLLSEEGYVGADVHLAARVGAAGHGGQIVLSAATAELAGRPLTPLGAHRLKDVEQAVSLYQLGDGSFPPLKTIANTNLPTPASSFVGREDELDEADRLLTQTRLLTVTGTGGAGKTRFALELARRARDERFGDYAAGVFSCFLAPLRDPALVVPTICQTLSVHEEPGNRAVDALAAHLEGKHMLLLLDNLEHIVACARELSELLQACPGLSLLVTSRMRLRVSGESEYELPPLPENEGVALFCERARVEPTTPIAELCSRLDGLPLAIELAAARTRILSPAQLLERLSSRLDLLKGGRDADPRQQTLRATIEWSYDLLSGEEQRLFRALAVFTGGFTLEAAEAVCSADLDTLESLLDKSLLRWQNTDTAPRFWMLETIREFAAELFRSQGEANAVQRRHACFMSVSLAEPPRLVDRAGWMQKLELERDNLRAALIWAINNETAGTRLTLASAYGWLCMNRGPVKEGISLLVDALGDGAEEDTQAYARALWGLGALSWREQDLDSAIRHHDACLVIARSIEDKHLEGRALRALGIVAAEKLEAARSTLLLEKSLAVFRELGDEAEIAECLNILGWAAVVRGDYPTAKELLEEALADSRSAGNHLGFVRCASNLAFVAAQQQRFAEALELIREGLVVARELVNDGMVGGLLLQLAPIAAERGSPEHCAILLGGAEALYEATESLFDARELEQHERAMAMLAQAYAPDHVDRLVVTGRSMTADELVASALAFVETESRRKSPVR